MHTLLVATHGGHVSELLALRDRIQNLGEQSWVTNAHPQTQVTMVDETVQFVPLIETRDVLGVLKAVPNAVRRIRGGRVTRVVSTGSGIALAYLPIAAALRVPSHYIESSTRLDAPSMTGRILAKVPGVTTWWQHKNPPSGWRSLDGLYAHFTAEPIESTAIKRIVVTVGTTDYCFRRLIARLVDIIPDGVHVFWQVGASDTTGLGIDGKKIVDAAELHAAIADADVVVTHAGAGSLLQSLQAGKVPVYAPRLGSRGEQVDDHQVELAQWADNAGLARRVDASSVTWDDLVWAASQRAVANDKTPIRLEHA